MQRFICLAGAAAIALIVPAFIPPMPAAPMLVLGFWFLIDRIARGKEASGI